MLWVASGIPRRAEPISGISSLCEDRRRNISSKFSWKFVYFPVQFIVPLVVLTVSGAGGGGLKIQR